MFPSERAQRNTGNTRIQAAATITNSLSFAGLPENVPYTDVLTGEIFHADGDSLSITVAPMSARLLLPQVD